MKQIKINYLHVLILFSGINLTVFSAKQTHKSAHHGGHSAKNSHAHSAAPAAPAASPTPSPNQNQAGIPNQINNSPIGMANPMSNSQNNQVPTNSQQRIITDTLDQKKVAELISDINNLQTNYEILSQDLERFIKDKYDVNNKQQNQKNKNKFYSKTDHWNIDCFRIGEFNPIKQIITIDGKLVAGVPPSTDGINPFTGNPATLQDIPMLQTIRHLLESTVNIIMQDLGAMIVANWNGDQLTQKNYDNSSHWVDDFRRNGKKVMFINNLPEGFFRSANYIADGKLKFRNFSIDRSKFVSHDKQVMPSNTYPR